MWSALENIALRESLPAPLKAGASIHGILIAGQLDRGRYNLHHLGRRRSKPYLLKQFYSIDTNAFLRWQNEARFIDVPQTPGFIWPSEEWRGGLISPFPEGLPLDSWLDGNSLTVETRLRVATMLAHQIARLHTSGIAHRGLSPQCVRVENHSISITDFGYAECCEWDDFWTDSTMTPGDTTCASPESLRGQTHGSTEDVYAFGCILHLLLAGKTAFGAFKRKLRTIAPGHIPPDTLPDDVGIPDDVRELTSSCLAVESSRRPTMDMAASVLSSSIDQDIESEAPIPVPETDATIADKQKVMVFIKEADLAIRLIDDALQMAQKTPSILLFTGLIPNNLPSGHAERFKGGLFRKLGQGLTHCRATDLPWSLRILENVDPAKAEEALIQQYQPDQVL